MNREQYKSYPTHFIASDIHFGHKNILKYCSGSRGDGQIFDSLSDDEVRTAVDAMNEKIIARWNSLVGTEDHTFILGDLVMGKMEHAIGLITRLNGFKTVIIGNHDRTLIKLPEMKTRESREEIKIVGLRDYLCFSPSKGTGVVMSHFPMSSWDGYGTGSIHFHGHLHGSPVQVIDAKNKRIMDVGIDNNDLCPFRLDDCIAKMKLIPSPKSNHHGSEQ
jgi:calcineurin-like phosphoesterase family protein